MVLQVLTSFAYDWVSSSWMITTLTIEVILVLHLAKLFYDENFSFQHLEETVVRYSRLVVLIIVTLGLAALVSGFEAEPPFKLLSEFLALLYFGFLFWRF